MAVSVHWLCPVTLLGSRLWVLNREMRVRTSGMQSELTLSLSFSVLAGHCISRELEHKGYKEIAPAPLPGPVVGDTCWCTFVLLISSDFSITSPVRQKNRNAIQPLPNLQQEIKGVGGWDEGKYAKSIICLCFPVCNFEGPIWRILLPLSCMSPLLLHNHLNAENEEAYFRSLRIFYMMTSIFTFSHTGKTQFSWSAI